MQKCRTTKNVAVFLDLRNVFVQRFYQFLDGRSRAVALPVPPDDESSGTFGNDSHRRWGASSSSCTSSRSAAFCRAHKSTTRPHRHRPSSRAHRRRRRRRRGRCPRRRGCCCQHVCPLCFSLFLFLSFDKSARALFLCRRRAWWFSFGYVSIKYTQDDDDDVDSRCFFFSFFFSFSFLFFERERVLFSCGTEKKTVERERRERETRRDCLISFFFFLDNTIAVVSPSNRIFSRKRHKNHDEVKKARAVLWVPKATTTTKTTTRTEHLELYSLSLGGEEKKGSDFESVLLEHRRKKKKKNDRARAAKRSAQSAFDDDATRGVDGASPSPFLLRAIESSSGFLGTGLGTQNAGVEIDHVSLSFFLRSIMRALTTRLSLCAPNASRTHIFFARANARTPTPTTESDCHLDDHDALLHQRGRVRQTQTRHHVAESL